MYMSVCVCVIPASVYLECCLGHYVCLCLGYCVHIMQIILCMSLFMPIFFTFLLIRVLAHLRVSVCMYLHMCLCQTPRAFVVYLCVWMLVTGSPYVCPNIQGVSRLYGITAGGDFLGLCDQKSSYKHVSDFWTVTEL